MTRTFNSIKNIKYILVGQAASVLISFFTRIVFVRILSSEYLGLNGLFTNILSILSFAELGIGSAITYSLYKPLAEKNQKMILALMRVFKQTYTVIGIIIAILGVGFTPFLELLIKDIPNIPYIQSIYLMFVINSVISYFFSYKRSLLIADQRKYIDTIYHYSFYFGLNIAQILILLITHNYMLFLFLQVINTLLLNIFLVDKVNKIYPFIKTKARERLDAQDKKTLMQNIKAMVFHKIGDIAVLGTDNLLISKYVGVIAVGLYSNYLLLISALNSVYGLIFQAITASVGNLVVTDTKEKVEYVFRSIELIGFWIYAFSSICFFNLFNPFIRIWLGEEYLFPMPLVLLIVINFYLTGMRKSVITFRDAMGLYWYDRYKPLFESGINLIVSVILVQQIGVIGVFIGTATSTLSTCFWVEPYVLYKRGFNRAVLPYFERYALKTSVMIIAGLITWRLCGLFNGVGMTVLILKIFICIVIPNTSFIVVFWKSEEFQYLVRTLKPIIWQKFKRSE